MKKLLLLALTAVMMAGCENYNDKTINSDYSVREIDSCEYIVLNGVGIRSHKGNCKYCQERRKQEIRELIKELKEGGK